MKIGLLNGPNLNLLGLREPGIYGEVSLNTIIERITNKAKINDINVISFQSNHEGELIDFIHNSIENKLDYIIFNPGAYTHTSIALHDAIAGVNAKVIEVHISNIYKREEFRHKSFISPVAVGVISGFGIYSYDIALDYIVNLNKQVN